MSDDLKEISRKAEANLNTVQAKTTGAPTQGLAQNTGGPESKVDFTDADFGDGSSSTRRGNYDAGLLPEEKGRGLNTQQGRSRWRRANQPGQFANEALPEQGSMPPKGDILREGQVASEINVGRKPPGPGGSEYKGVNYYNPETVPDSISAEGNVPPESVTEASRETEGYGK
ncbi:hypothetical protein ESCO_006339 [Escovopsis weberi]|uniref:Uncharacterized protein n=1 Tax=Escovopsis weberi TaxID=150374 RepID=A0A0M8MVL2_ESCWE|nr:hypothetical protein ESCO_006339 [Escovopsis weberi]